MVLWCNIPENVALLIQRVICTNFLSKLIDNQKYK